jgi:hypothetical protein
MARTFAEEFLSKGILRPDEPGASFGQRLGAEINAEIVKSSDPLFEPAVLGLFLLGPNGPVARGYLGLSTISPFTLRPGAKLFKPLRN